MINANNRWWALIGISILFFCAGLDLTIVSTALPTIQDKLNLSLFQLQWIANVYLLFNCIFLTAMGYLGDLYGRRLMLYICIGLFVLATLICGLANTGFWIAFGRGTQGLVEAILMPCSLGLISVIFSNESERARAIGIWSSFVGIGMIAGSGLGGLIINYFGWRWAFFIKLPILFIAFIMILLTVPESRSKTEKISFDWLGFFAISLGIACLIVPIINVSKWGLISIPFLSLVILSFILFYLFYKIEKKSTHPLFRVSFFTNRIFLACAGIQFVLLVFIATTLFLIPLYLQVIRNIPVSTMGFLMMIIPLAMFVFSIIAGQMFAKLKTKTAILIGLLPLMLTALIQIFFGLNTSQTLIILAFILFGASWGWILSTTATAALNTLSTDFVSSGIGILWTIQIAGGVIGLAIFGSLFRYQDRIFLLKNLNIGKILLTPSQQTLVHSLLSDPEHAIQILKQQGIAVEQLLPLFAKAFIEGYSTTMFSMFILFLLCSLVTFFLIKKKPG